LIPLLIAVPVGVVLLILAPRYKVAAQVTAIAGLILMIVAVTMAYRRGKTKELDKEMDSVPVILRGGGAFIFYQVKFALDYPRLLAPWVFLEFFGMAVLLTGGILFESINWAANENPYIPPPAREVAKVTGAATINKLLSDLAEPATCQAAAEQLAKMKPDQHQEGVARGIDARGQQLRAQGGDPGPWCLGHAAGGADPRLRRSKQQKRGGAGVAHGGTDGGGRAPAAAKAPGRTRGRSLPGRHFRSQGHWHEEKRAGPARRGRNRQRLPGGPCA
jgi:hypothetical protein